MSLLMLNGWQVRADGQEDRGSCTLAMSRRLGSGAGQMDRLYRSLVMAHAQRGRCKGIETVGGANRRETC